jgi:hypothetical protein
MSTKRPSNRKPAGPGRQEKENPTPRATSASNRPTTPSSTERVRSSAPAVKAPRVKKDLIFNRNNYILLGAAGLAMMLGIVLMSGGEMPDPNTWDENIIYGSRRMVVAPIFMLGGVVLGIVAIFRK